MSLKRSHTLYLQSKYRTLGTTSQYTLALPDFIQSDPNNELFKVSLVSFTTYNDILQITDNCNTVRVDNVDYVIPYGTYTFQKLARTLQAILTIPVHWNTELNAITFVFDTETTVRFDDIAYILGFDSDVNYTGTNITSIRAMKPMKPTHLMIHLNNVSVVNEHLNLSNHTGEIRISNVLAKVLINAEPYRLITYNQILENEGLYTGENSLNLLEILITDNDGNEVASLPEHELVLKIETVDVEDYDTKSIINELREMRQTLKDLLVYKVLRR